MHQTLYRKYRPATFEDVSGQEHITSVLRYETETGRTAHAYLFCGSRGTGKTTCAKILAKAVNCEHPVNGDACGECPSCRQMAKLVHPDVHFVFPVAAGSVIKDDHPVSDMGVGAFRELFLKNPYFSEQDLYDALGVEGKSGNISVYEAKNIINQLSLSAVAGGYKAVVMFLPERMNTQAANKLLKILEEPPAKTVFMLITQNPEDVMSTIFSRCQGLRILPFDRSQLVVSAYSEENGALWNSLCGALLKKNLYEALECADAIAALGSREKQKAFCNFASEQIRKAFLCDKGLEDIAYVTDGEVPVKGLSSRFCIKAVSFIDKASMLIGRNVSAKMVFTDLVNRLFVNL